MIRYSIALALCAMLALGAAAYGATGSSFFGPTGLIAMPTADTLGMGQFRAFANYVNRSDSTEAPFGVNVGLGYGLEIGATRIHETGSDGGDTNIINAKWTAYKGNLVMPSIAIGALNVTDSDDFLGSIIVAAPTGKIDPYVVASKALKVPGVASLSVHAGYLAGNFNRGMFGAQLSIPSTNIDLMAEYIPSFTKLSFGVRYNVASGLGIQAATLDGDFFAGIAYTRGLGR